MVGAMNRSWRGEITHRKGTGNFANLFRNSITSSREKLNKNVSGFMLYFASESPVFCLTC